MLSDTLIFSVGMVLGAALVVCSFLIARAKWFQAGRFPWEKE